MLRVCEVNRIMKDHLYFLCDIEIHADAWLLETGSLSVVDTWVWERIFICVARFCRESAFFITFTDECKNRKQIEDTKYHEWC